VTGRQQGNLDPPPDAARLQPGRRSAPPHARPGRGDRRRTPETVEAIRAGLDPERSPCQRPGLEGLRLESSRTACLLTMDGG